MALILPSLHVPAAYNYAVPGLKLLCFPDEIGTNVGFIRQSEVQLRPRAVLSFSATATVNQPAFLCFARRLESLPS